MKRPYLAFAFLLGLLACGSDSADGRYKTSDEAIKKSQIETKTQASIDRVAKATPHGNITFPLPDTLTALLRTKQPPVQVAPLPDQILTQKQRQVDNPLYVTGDFNGDLARDYAVQVLANDSIRILAFLDYAGQAQEIRIASYPAQKLSTGWHSLYQLKLAPKDSMIFDFRTQKRRPLEKDGISVLEKNRTTLYLLHDNRFIPFDLQQ